MASWLRRKSFQARLGALVAGAVGVAIALASLASYFAVHHQIYSQLDSSMSSEVALFAGGRVSTNGEGLFLRRYNNSLLQVIAPDSSTPAYSSVPLGAPYLPVSQQDLSVASSGPGAGPTFRSITYNGQRYRLLTVGASDEVTGAPLAIQIARPLSDISHTLGELRLILWIVALSGVALAVGLGYLIGKATIRPVKRLTAAAEHVAATQDLSATIDDSGEDELARLARTFNDMLGALASSRQQQAQLISDAGHELRTPLTSLRTNIEVLLRTKDLPQADRAELLADVQAQLEEMTTLIGDVVELGRGEETQSEPIEVRFDLLVEKAVDRARRRAPNVRFDVQLTPGSVRAQPALLERAVLNVLDNAAKFSPPDGTVRVWLQRDQRWALDVLDHGPGIAPEDLPHVFDRFYRAESARSLPGSGLGLAIVRQVVNAHGGDVSVTAPPGGGGTLVHIELPIVSEHEPTADDRWSPEPVEAHSWPPPPAPANGTIPTAEHPVPAHDPANPYGEPAEARPGDRR